MALLPILTAPDPRLAQVSAPVQAVDDAVRRLMNDMLETMYAAPGIGLAAIQVGVAQRVLVLDIAGEDEPRNPMFFANPEIIWASDEDKEWEEGCLSVPDHYANIVRPAAIKVRYFDYQNELREIEADGILAVCLQHEMDHLDGILFIDRLSSIKRNMILRKMLKSQRLEKA